MAPVFVPAHDGDVCSFRDVAWPGLFLFFAGYGLRAVTGDLAFELLFVRPLNEDFDIPTGLPMLTATVRAR